MQKEEVKEEVKEHQDQNQLADKFDMDDFEGEDVESEIIGQQKKLSGPQEDDIQIVLIC